jgi:hypothetical protein
LNGASYDQHFLDATRTSSLSRADSSNPDSVAALNRDLDDCALLANNKGKPLLASLAGGKSTADGKLLIQAVVRHLLAWVANLKLPSSSKLGLQLRPSCTGIEHLVSSDDSSLVLRNLEFAVKHSANI